MPITESYKQFFNYFDWLHITDNGMLSTDVITEFSKCFKFSLNLSKIIYDKWRDQRTYQAVHLKTMADKLNRKL